MEQKNECRIKVLKMKKKTMWMFNWLIEFEMKINFNKNGIWNINILKYENFNFKYET